jgi:hypothetical protein
MRIMSRYIVKVMYLKITKKNVLEFEMERVR